MAKESKGTVWVALGSNALVAVVKFVAGFLTGSAALFAEGAHSIADTMDQAFLLTAIRKSNQPADRKHQFGYGKERFFWSLLAAVGIFVAGAGFSTIEAYQAFTSHEEITRHYFLIAYVALAIAGLAEGTSWLRAISQVREEAKATGRGVIEHIRRSPDPTVKTVASEDSAALVGLVFAFGGIALHQATGHGWWEGVSAALIALLLVGVAFALGHDTKDLLIGESAEPELQDDIEALLARHGAVDEVIEVLTMRLGPDELLVAARLDLSDDISAGDVEQVSADLDATLNDHHGQIKHVFLDATRSGERKRRDAAGTRG